MVENNKKILEEVCTYYAEKIREHGESPRGVDWNGEESQFLRFRQLMKVLKPEMESFSINDIGCGYGALVDFLGKECKGWNYFGVDVSADMVNTAKNRYAGVGHVSFEHTSKLSNVADYSVASGIFNVRLANDSDSWWDYVTEMLDMMNEHSRMGFAFNCLTNYSDPDKTREYLYYADPCRLFDWCKVKYSRQVALLHDYGLYEFTILVKKI